MLPHATAAVGRDQRVGEPGRSDERRGERVELRFDGDQPCQVSFVSYRQQVAARRPQAVGGLACRAAEPAWA